MTDFLLFTLYAPLASWGEIAVGESRGSWDRPSRSAVLGLIGAALGLDRGDQAAHDALDVGYGIAVRADAVGRALVDYHTTQSVPESVLRKRAPRPRTRRELLETDARETILSRRTYRQDALSTVAVWPRATPRWPLDELASALRRPVYVLYAGRKANALGMPLTPIIVSAGTIAGAFAHRNAAQPAFIASAISPRGHGAVEVSHDTCDFPTGLRPLRRETRRDTAPHRPRWQFATRVVEVGALDDVTPTSAQPGEP